MKLENLAFYQRLSKKEIDQKGKNAKTIKIEASIKQLGDQHGKLSYTSNFAKPSMQKGDFFLGKDLYNRKPWTVCLPQPLNFIFISINHSPQLQLSADTEYTHLPWGNIWQSICFRLTQPRMITNSTHNNKKIIQYLER